jgi:hypothetical protein
LAVAVVRTLAVVIHLFLGLRQQAVVVVPALIAVIHHQAVQAVAVLVQVPHHTNWAQVA